MKNKGVTTTGSRPIAICTQPGPRECRVHFLWPLYFTKNKQIRLFSPSCRSSVILHLRNLNSQLGRLLQVHATVINLCLLIRLMRGPYLTWRPQTNGRTEPPLALVFAHTCLWKMLLNLVSKISLLGDDRKEPRRGCRITVESETGAISGSIFPKFLHICTKYPTCHFSPNLSHVFFFAQT